MELPQPWGRGTRGPVSHERYCFGLKLTEPEPPPHCFRTEESSFPHTWQLTRGERNMVPSAFGLQGAAPYLSDPGHLEQIYSDA